MDIFIIEKNNTKKISSDLLNEFRYKNISNKKRLYEHCFSYIMLDKILKEVYHIENREIEFVNGKPFLLNREKFFCISHTKKYIALCFSDNDCGIDIEQIKKRDYEAIAKRMNFSCTTQEEFYYEWTRYEAEYKLNDKPQSIKQFKYEDSIITALSNDLTELFNIYIQNGDFFSNLH